jgi:hypothetical protein
MQENKLIITGDYLDTNTGLRFLEDIRGNLHFCNALSMSGMEKNITIEFNPIIEIPPINIPPISLPSGNYNCSPEIIVTVDLAYEKDKEIFDLLNENAWLWGLIQQAIKDKKEKNCSYAMTKLEQTINGGMP